MRDKIETYVATYREGATRDTQIYRGNFGVTGGDPFDEGPDGWVETKRAQVYIGIFTGKRDAVLEHVAELEGCHTSSICLTPITQAEEVDEAIELNYTELNGSDLVVSETLFTVRKKWLMELLDLDNETQLMAMLENSEGMLYDLSYKDVMDAAAKDEASDFTVGSVMKAVTLNRGIVCPTCGSHIWHYTESADGITSEFPYTCAKCTATFSELALLKEHSFDEIIHKEEVK